MKQHFLSLSMHLFSLSFLPNLLVLAFQSPPLPNSDSHTNANFRTNTPSSSSSSSSPTTKHPWIVFPDFEFTPNGICTNPRHFVDAKSRQWFSLRNVPGEGDCMFLAVAVAAATMAISIPPQFTSSTTGSHARLYSNMPDQHEHESIATTSHASNDVPSSLADFLDEVPSGLVGEEEEEEQDASYWHVLAKNTRERVAQVLESSHDTLYIGKNRPLVTSGDLLRSATRQEGLPSTQHYLQSLRTLGRHGGLYGGGPELTVLSNLLQRPIAIYEVAASDVMTSTTSSASATTIRDGFCPIVCRGIFGDGRFDHPPMSTNKNNDYNNNHNHNNHHSNDGFNDHWRLNILVVDVSPQEKHACVLIPTPRQQIKLP